MWRFFLAHPFASVGMVLGSVIAVGTRMNDAYTLVNAGLPASAWEAIGAAIFFMSVILLLYQWEKSRSATALPATAPIAVPHVAPAPADDKPSTAAQRILKDAIAAGPEFRARFGRSGRDARFYIEFSHYTGSLAGEAWTRPERIPVFTKEVFSRNEVITFPLTSKRDNSASFHLGQYGPNGHELWRNNFYKARVSLVTEPGEEEHCYFIAEVGDAGSPPRIIGEHMFDHIHTWEGRPPPNGDAESLFR